MGIWPGKAIESPNLAPESRTTAPPPIHVDEALVDVRLDTSAGNKGSISDSRKIYARATHLPPFMTIAALSPTTATRKVTTHSALSGRHGLTPCITCQHVSRRLTPLMPSTSRLPPRLQHSLPFTTKCDHDPGHWQFSPL